MNYFANLQAPQVKNALLDFSPVNNALSEVREQNNVNRNALMRAEEQTYQRGRDAKQDQRYEQQDMRQQVQLFGKRAEAIDQIQDPAQRQALWGKIIASHPNRAALTPEYLDPVNGPKLVMAEAGQYLDPRDSRAKDLDIQYKQAQIGKINRDDAPDPVEQLLLDRLQNRRQPAPPQQPRPYLQPQSFDGQAPQGGLQLISDETAQPAPLPPEAETIDTPFGPMSRQEATELGGAMLLQPKRAAAGKALLDSVQQAGGGGLSKPAETQLDERTISAASTLGRLQSIRQSFKPEFQQIPQRLKLIGASWGAAFGGKLSPDMQKQLSDFAAFKAAGFDNFNQLLKELSGTAVSAQELARQKIVQPNPGEGLFDGDDPVTFMSKMQQGEKIAKSAIARMNFMRTRGIRFNTDTAEQFLRLEDVPEAIDRRGSEIEQQIKQNNPKADPMSIDQQVKKQLKQEFGI